MNKETAIVLFNHKAIRRTWHQNEWWFSVADTVAALTESINPNEYIKKIRSRDHELSKGWGQFVTPLLVETKGMPANKKVAKRGGKVAGNARKETEKELGKSITNNTNFLPDVDKKLEKV